MREASIAALERCTRGLLANLAANVAAQHHPGRSASVNRVLDDDGAVDDDCRAGAAWITMRVCVSGFVTKITWVEDSDISPVPLLQ